jgi:hypothetical protein
MARTLHGKSGNKRRERKQNGTGDHWRFPRWAIEKVVAVIGDPKNESQRSE